MMAQCNAQSPAGPCYLLAQIHLKSYWSFGNTACRSYKSPDCKIKWGWELNKYLELQGGTWWDFKRNTNFYLFLKNESSSDFQFLFEFVKPSYQKLGSLMPLKISVLNTCFLKGILNMLLKILWEKDLINISVLENYCGHFHFWNW